MSGQQIGTVIGGTIGAFFGAPTLGMAIGGFIGGLIDPTKVNGPHTSDGSPQSATDGSAIAVCLGTGWVTGTIVQVGPRYDVKVKDSGGKGGGPTVSHYEAHQTFCILVCESDWQRGTGIQGILAVEQDGKIVYDVRAGSTMLSDSNKWFSSSGVEFHFGQEDQLPSPTLEYDTGVGNTPAYRGVVTAIFKSFNLSKAGGRIPSFRFLVSNSYGQGVAAQSSWRYLTVDYYDVVDRSAPGFDDSSWPTGAAPLGDITASPIVGTHAHAWDSRFSASIATVLPLGHAYWLRSTLVVTAIPASFQLIGYFDNGAAVYVNGVQIWSTGSSTDSGVNITVSSAPFVVGNNTIAVRAFDIPPPPAPIDAAYYDFMLLPNNVDVGTPQPVPVSSIFSFVCKRGGLTSNQYDASALSGLSAMGFPIAKQMTGADCLLPLLNAYFGYASEYDSKLRAGLYGQNVVMTVNPADVLEGNSSSDDAITKTLRNQETEFPKTFIGTYFDPAQNWFPVNVMRTRPAVAVTSTGASNYDMPVAMSANDALQAIDKAMKVAWATLEGTLAYSLPFGTPSNCYLQLCAGESVAFNGKRYVVDEFNISAGSLSLTTRYDRQSAYTSNVQAIAGVAPTNPASPYSGPTTLVVLQIPSLRTQDGYGVYLCAASADGSANWRGCSILISFDGGQTWQNSIDIPQASDLGTLSVNEPTSPPHEPLTVQLTNGSLASVTSGQIAVGANAFALIDAASGNAEVGQFLTAAEDPTTAGLYTLTGTYRGLNGTTEVLHHAGDVFTMLDSAYFVPIDLGLKGKTIQIRAVGYGENADSQPVQSFVYNPDTTIIYSGGVVTT